MNAESSAFRVLRVEGGVKRLKLCDELGKGVDIVGYRLWVTSLRDQFEFGAEYMVECFRHARGSIAEFEVQHRCHCGKPRPRFISNSSMVTMRMLL